MRKQRIWWLAKDLVALLSGFTISVWGSLKHLIVKNGTVMIVCRRSVAASVEERKLKIWWLAKDLVALLSGFTECVGLTEAPDCEKWYCDDCLQVIIAKDYM